jgi:hypothetical protein
MKKIIKILDDINESIQYFNLNNKTPMKANNEEID